MEDDLLFSSVLPFKTPMNHPRKENPKLYTEVVLVTILSLVASSLWIEWTKGFILKLCPEMLLPFAFIITLLAVLILQIIFA